MPLNDQVLAPGQWGYLALDTDVEGGATAAVSSAIAAGLSGLWVKYSDGRQPDPWRSSFSRVAAAAAGRLRIIPMLVVYAQDAGDPTWGQIAAEASALATDAPDLLIDPDDMNGWAQAGSPAAQRLFAQLGTIMPGVRPLSACWGNTGGVPDFPWPDWCRGCRAILPEIYPASYGKSPADTYNMAFIGNPGRGLENMQPPPAAVIPTFDVSQITGCAALAKTGGFPTVGWWHVGNFTTDVVHQLAKTGYAAAPATSTTPAQLLQDAQAEIAQAAHELPG